MSNPPVPGLYVSKTDREVRLVVEEVNMVDESFFLVTVVGEGEEGDVEAIAEEYDPDDWRSLVKEYDLQLVEET